MPNMSYVRYQNTLADLQDCYRDMRFRADGGEEDPLSRDEFAAQHDLINLCKRIVELAEQQEEEEVCGKDIKIYFSLKDLPVSKGNHRYLITEEWFIWRDEEHCFLSKVSDPEYYWQLNACLEGNDLLEEAYDVIELNDDSYGYKDQKNFD